VAVDGAFADWTRQNRSSDGIDDVANPNIEIVEDAAASHSGKFFAYVKFDAAGRAMAGMSVPQARVASSGGGGGGGGGGGTTVLPRIAGEDIARLYIDSKPNEGSSIGGISADFILELRGRNGGITSKQLLTYPERVPVAGGASAEAGGNALEASVTLAQIGTPNGTVQMYVETTDWEKAGDKSAVFQTRSGGTRGAASSTPCATTVGTPVVFNSAYAAYISSCYDTANQKVVIAYRNSADNYRGYAVVATVSGETISYGTPVAFSGASTDAHQITAVYDSAKARVVISYVDDSGYGTGYTVVGQVTTGPDTLTFSAETTFDTSNTVCDICSVYDPVNDAIVLAYDKWISGDGLWEVFMRVGTVGTAPDSISWGAETAAVWWGASRNGPVAMAYDTGNSKVVAAYAPWGGGTLAGLARVGTVSGGTITFTSDVTFNAQATSLSRSSLTYDSAHGRVVIAYLDTAGTDVGEVVVGTVTTSPDAVTFGTPVQFSTVTSEYPTAAFDDQNDVVAIAYTDYDNDLGRILTGTVASTGNSITLGSAHTFESSYCYWTTAVYDVAHQRVVVAYADWGNSDYGTGVVVNNTPEFPAVAVPIIICIAPLILIRARRRPRHG
jgi:hypothetical protein